jgi:hypothetical protein
MVYDNDRERWGIEVIGASLHVVVLNASTTFVIGGITHDIPIIVHACVEALLRRGPFRHICGFHEISLHYPGIHQSGLFRTLPNKCRWLELVDTFTDGPSYGGGFNLQNKTISDICTLLVGFLDSLPHAVIDPILYGPFWYWCIMPTIRRHNSKRKVQETAEANACGAALERGEKIPITEFVYQEPLRWTKDEEVDNEIREQPQIAVAVILLKMLPAANLSLLVYLFGFFTKLPLCPDNGIEPDDIARIFGHSLMGGKSKSDAMKLMLWLLKRWPKISDKLFIQSTTAWERKLKNATQSVGDSPSTTSDGMMESTGESNRTRSSDHVASATEDRPRYGLYQFSPKGFPASRDLHALSRGVAEENYSKIAESTPVHRSTGRDCSPFDYIDRIEDWKEAIGGK